MSKFQNSVKRKYEKDGYLVLNIIKLSDSGFPDLQCIKDGKSIFIECKEANDTLKDLQKHRIDQLIKVGCTAFCLQDGKGVIYP